MTIKKSLFRNNIPTRIRHGLAFLVKCRCCCTIQAALLKNYDLPLKRHLTRLWCIDVSLGAKKGRGEGKLFGSLLLFEYSTVLEYGLTLLSWGGRVSSVCEVASILCSILWHIGQLSCKHSKRNIYKYVDNLHFKNNNKWHRAYVLYD